MSWRRYFQPRVVFLDRDGHPGRLGEGRGLPVRVVPRSRLQFERLRMPDASHRARKSVAMRVVQTRQFAEPRLRLVFDIGNPREAVAWTWDDAPAQRLNERLFPPPAIPEPLLYPPMETGQRLVDCLEGFEGQIWRDGVLRASRWWPRLPDRVEWLMFLRSAKGAAVSFDAAGAPSPERLALSADAAAVIALASDTDNLRRIFEPSRLAALTAMAFALLFGFQATVFAGEAARAGFAQSRYAAFVEKNRTLMADRQLALSTLAAIDQHAGAIPAASVSSVLAGLLSSFSPDEVSVLFVRFVDRTFEAKLQPSAPIDAAALVARLETINGLNAVSIVVNEADQSMGVSASTIDFVGGQTAAAPKP